MLHSQISSEQASKQPMDYGYKRRHCIFYDYHYYCSVVVLLVLQSHHHLLATPRSPQPWIEYISIGIRSVLQSINFFYQKCNVLSVNALLICNTDMGFSTLFTTLVSLLLQFFLYLLLLLLLMTILYAESVLQILRICSNGLGGVLLWQKDQ